MILIEFDMLSSASNRGHFEFYFYF